MTQIIRPEDFKPSEMTSIFDVRMWFQSLLAHGYAFHPDDDLTEYTNTDFQTGQKLNAIMDRCWEICVNECDENGEQNRDIYDIANELTRAHMNWPKNYAGKGQIDNSWIEIDLTEFKKDNPKYK